MKRELPSPGSRALKMLLALACVVILIAGVKAAKMVCVPILLAVFLALLGQAPAAWLRERGVPGILAAIGVGLVTVALLVGVGLAFAASLAEFRQELPAYRERLSELGATIQQAATERGIPVPGELSAVLGEDRLTGLLSAAAGEVFRLGSLVVLVLGFVFFVLLEFSDFRLKLQLLAGRGKSLETFRRSCRQVRRYIAVKSLMGLLTGVGAGILFHFFDVRFALLWAILVFAFNYIPVAGSIVIGIPPIALAFLDLGPSVALVVLVLYVALNLSISNLLEPLLMGNQLGLSALAVFAALVFWGWVWGPVGMLLAVPLTRIAKIFFENTEELRWVSTLLGRLPAGLRDEASETHRGTPELAVRREAP